MPARVKRYPFRRALGKAWAEVPFDATDRAAPTFRARLRDLPSEKLNALRFKLRSANGLYGEVRENYLQALAAARRDPWRDLPADERARLGKALLVLATHKDIGEDLREVLRSALVAHLERARAARAAEAGGDESAPPTEPEAPAPALAVAELRSNPAFASPFGERVLLIAEALEVGDRAVAEARVNETFAEPLNEGLGAIVRARREIVKVGVVGHQEIEGELTDLETGQPLLDAAGQPRVEPIPFVSAPWSHNGKKLEGCSEETLAFYSAACEGEGLVIALSEAVLLHNRALEVTPAAVWDSYLGPLKPAAGAGKAETETEAPPDTPRGDSEEDTAAAEGAAADPH